MILPDVNVLLYAFRRDDSRHEKIRRWLGGVVNGDAAYGVSPQTLASLVRISTHPGIYVHPSSLSEALDFCHALLDPGRTIMCQRAALVIRQAFAQRTGGPS